MGGKVQAHQLQVHHRAAGRFEQHEEVDSLAYQLGKEPFWTREESRT